MKKRYFTWAMLTAFLILFAVVSSAGELLKTEPAMRSEISDLPGTYTMILYGARNSQDVESVVILDKEGDAYTIVPNARDFEYKKKEHVDGAYALEHGEEFINWHPSYSYTSIRKIFVNGSVVGYEMRPFYDPLRFGQSDVMWISYTLSGQTITVTVMLKPEVERIIEGDGNDDRWH